MEYLVGSFSQLFKKLKQRLLNKQRYFQAFFATIRSSSAGVNEPSTTAEVEVPRPETPPADYETAFEGMHISNKQTQQRTTAVMY